MAATQIKNSSIEDVITMVEEVVEKYFEDEKN
jgi:DHH family phosphoesterase